MAEVLVSGPPDRPPRRGLRLAAAVATVVVAGWILAPRVLTVTQHGPPQPSPTPAALGPATPGPTDPNLTPVSVQPQLDGVPGTLPTGLTLAIGGTRPTGVGATTGPATALARIPLGSEDLVTAVIRLPTGLLVQVYRGSATTWVPGDVYLIDGTGRIRLLTHADQLAVSAHLDSLFTVRYGGPDGNGPKTFEQVSWSGQVLTRRQAPEGLALQADTPQGLLVTMLGSGQAADELQFVDPKTMAVIRDLGPIGYVVGATATWAAWTTTSDCTAACTLAVADWAGGTRYSLALAAGFDPAAAVLNPDLRHLAIGYRGQHPQQSGGAAPGFVEVADLATGRSVVVPGVAAGIKQSADLAWTLDGRTLVISVGWPDLDLRRTGIWPLGGGPVHVLRQVLPGGNDATLTVL